MQKFPSCDYEECPSGEDFLAALKPHGLMLVKNVPYQNNSAVLELAKTLGKLLVPPGALRNYKIEDGFVYRVEPGCQPGCGPISQTSSEFEFHTDGFCLTEAPDIVLMLAIQPSQSGGETQFVHINEVLPDLSSQDIAWLFEHKYSFPPAIKRSILTGNEESPLVAFNPYDVAGMNMNDRSVAQSVFIDEQLKLSPNVYKFYRAVKTSPAMQSFRYATGDCLVIDNRKILHARLPFDGTRLLKRVWVQRESLN